MAMQAEDGNIYYVTQTGEVLSNEDFLPYPWNPRFAPQPKTANAQTEGLATVTAESTQESSSLTSGECPGMGFYRIFQLPKWPNGISNATVEGLTFAGVDFDDYFSQLSNFRLFVDGQPTELGIARTRAFTGVTNEGVDFWFNEMANGSRQLRMTAEIRLDDTIGEFLLTPTLTLTSTLTSVTVSNLILYTNFENTIVGNSSVFEAFSTIPNVNWEINVYDVVDDFVISHSGFSSSGQISWTWDCMTGRDCFVMIGNTTRGSIQKSPSRRKASDSKRPPLPPRNQRRSKCWIIPRPATGSLFIRTAKRGRRPASNSLMRW
jgi:hypothetical protein